MANSQPPNEPRCNLVALLLVTKHNSRAETAGSYENEPGGDLTSFAGPSSRSPSRSLPLPTFSGPSGGSRPGHASSAGGDWALGACFARDLGLCPCSTGPSPSQQIRPPGARPTGSWCPEDTGARLPVPGRPLSSDSPVELGRSWRLLSRHIPTNKRSGQGCSMYCGPCPGERPSLGASPGCARAPRAPRGAEARVPGGSRPRSGSGREGSWEALIPGTLTPDSPRAVAALQLTPALGPASPLAHLGALRASRSPPASPHRTSR